MKRKKKKHDDETFDETFNITHILWSSVNFYA